MFNSDGRVSHHRSFALFPFFLSVFFFFLLLFQIGRGYFSLDLIFVPCMWGILIPLLDSFFGKAALRLTNWENWRLTSTFQAALTAKVFSFRFTNAFLVLYYYIFSDQGSLVRLTTSVASFMLVGQLLRFFMYPLHL